MDNDKMVTDIRQYAAVWFAFEKYAKGVEDIQEEIWVRRKSALFWGR